MLMFSCLKYLSSKALSRRLCLPASFNTLIFPLLVLMLLSPVSFAANDSFPLFSVTDQGEGQNYSVSIKILLLMTLLTFLPAILMAMTAFTRIIIVFAILRQALGMPQTPSNQILLAIALFLTLFIMQPMLEQTWQLGVQPYTEGTLNEQQAFEKGMQPIREFMIHQTRESDLAVFSELRQHEPYQTLDDIPLMVLIPSFITSELKTAFQIGFLIFIPFVVIDLVVASILMSMGMMMLSPMIISLPFKIMLFVLVDGWVLTVSTLVNSFYVT